LVGGTGYFASNAVNNSLTALSEEAMTPSVLIGRISQIQTQNLVLLYQAVDAKKQNNASAMTSTIATVRQNSDTISKTYAEYAKSIRSPEEKAAADSFVAKRTAFVQQGITPVIDMLEGRNPGDPEAHLSRTAGPLNRAAYDEANVIYRILAERAVALEKSGHETYRNSAIVTGIVSLFVALIGIWLVRAMSRAIMGSLKQLDQIFEKIGNGNYESRVEIERDDEIGSVLKQVEALQTKLGFSRFEMADQQKKAEAEKRAAMMNLAADLEAQVKDVVENVSGAAGTMQSSAAGMSSNAEQTTRQATAVAAASEEASTNVQTVAAATEELASSVKEIGRQVAQSTEIASRAVGQAQKTDQTVSGLSEAAQKIGEVVDLIRNIASQTNLLALNATIEAARAGDAGKGFAVVASEVKNLANQTAKATEDITAQIAAIQESTGEAVRDIKSIGTTITEISKISGTIAAAVEEQGAATQEIARNVQEASAGTQQVNSNIAGVTEASSGTGKSANDVLVAANGLSAQSDRLRGVVDEFIKTVRAA
jgi:methyl-accepting chemotaxis protein